MTLVFCLLLLKDILSREYTLNVGYSRLLNVMNEMKTKKSLHNSHFMVKYFL